jgi:4-aminobutyrate aminotransferase-like enzyme
MMSGVFVAPFPYAYRYGWEPEQTADWCLDELRYMLLTCGTWDNTMRFIPSLAVTAEQIEDGLARFERALARALEG